MPLASTSISIKKATLERYYNAYPVGQRSQTIQRLIEQDLDQAADQLANAVLLVENHPDFHARRNDGLLWEHVTLADGLDTLIATLASEDMALVERSVKMVFALS